MCTCATYRAHSVTAFSQSRCFYPFTVEACRPTPKIWTTPRKQRVAVTSRMWNVSAVIAVAITLRHSAADHCLCNAALNAPSRTEHVCTILCRTESASRQDREMNLNYHDNRAIKLLLPFHPTLTFKYFTYMMFSRTVSKRQISQRKDVNVILGKITEKYSEVVCSLYDILLNNIYIYIYIYMYECMYQYRKLNLY